MQQCLVRRIICFLIGCTRASEEDFFFFFFFFFFLLFVCEELQMVPVSATLWFELRMSFLTFLT